LENSNSKSTKSKDDLHVDKDVYLKAFENSGIYAKLNSSLNIKYANRQFYQITHRTKKESLNVDLSTLMKNSTDEILEVIRCKQSWEGTQVFIISNGGEIYLKCSFIPILDKNGSLYEVLFLASDITELTQRQISTKNSIYQDTLTKLPNRLSLFSNKALQDKDKESTYITFNIDSFDSINNLYGNYFGDEILIQVAKWLEQNLLTPKTTLYKFEADIYTSVCLEPIDKKVLFEYLEKISKHIQEQKFSCEDTQIDISMTIGAAQSNSNQIKLSQIAYKEAKLSKKSFAIYDKCSNKEEEYKNNLQTSKVIRNAIDKDLIIPFFQPILNVSTNKIEKHEVLMRIKNKEGKILSPYEFLNLAKHSKAYPKLSRSLIEKSIDYFSVFPSEFSINLSFLDIINPKTTKFILDILEKSGMGPWIIFELLESEGIENYKEVMHFTEQVKSYGTKIAIDDFGSGYSNFERLIELQVDFIKIDGSLIKNIDRNEDMRIITKNIAIFTKELGIKTIAEFVHSEAVFNEVKNLNIDFAQGYFIGKPSEVI